MHAAAIVIVQQPQHTLYCSMLLPGRCLLFGSAGQGGVWIGGAESTVVGAERPWLVTCPVGAVKQLEPEALDPSLLVIVVVVVVLVHGPS